MKIINFYDKKLEYELKKIKLNSIPNYSFLNLYKNSNHTKISIHSEKIFNMYIKNNLNYEIENLQQNFETKKSKFKIPHILKKYRKGINPIHAFFQETQKILFIYDHSLKEDKWTMLYLKNKVFLKDVVDALILDRNNIIKLQSKYKNYNLENIHKEMSILTNVRINIDFYIEVFSHLLKE